MIKNEDWKTLTIARNKSQEFNTEMKNKFSTEESDAHSSPVCFQNSPK
jgi:hypothetical protein